MLRMMCREVAGQKRRLGGDFAVAWLLLSRRMRDIAREACPDRDDAIVTFTQILAYLDQSPLRLK